MPISTRISMPLNLAANAGSTDTVGPARVVTCTTSLLFVSDSAAASANGSSTTASAVTLGVCCDVGLAVVVSAAVVTTAAGSVTTAGGAVTIVSAAVLAAAKVVVSATADCKTAGAINSGAEGTLVITASGGGGIVAMASAGPGAGSYATPRILLEISPARLPAGGRKLLPTTTGEETDATTPSVDGS